MQYQSNPLESFAWYFYYAAYEEYHNYVNLSGGRVSRSLKRLELFLAGASLLDGDNRFFNIDFIAEQYERELSPSGLVSYSISPSTFYEAYLNELTQEEWSDIPF